mmetsp:Transcript_75049/g.176184  ORF Transcript_75049/g.176184 Transcript_75049/m.176184 type:complete len:207 (-) Transcript_75049:542-1162(-)
MNRGCETERGTAGIADRTLAIREHLDVRPRSLQPQLAQVALEDAVDLDTRVPLPLCLLNVEFGLLGHVEWDVLLRRGASHGAAPLELRLSRQDLDGEGTALVGEGEGVVLSAELAERHARDDVVGHDRRQQRLVVVHTHLPRHQRNQHQRQVPRGVHGHGVQALYRRGQVDRVVLLALHMVVVHNLALTSHNDVPMRLHNRNRNGI